ncbi:MAG TPA: hypothetical protein DCS28_03305 [Candidatus Moranbacteria bacterium]|nr:hypothetical protein [Candidatus Moranbacteria bacterium]HAT75039.1 hypothetical protein [Candidatus Moranbacteria bacterium]
MLKKDNSIINNALAYLTGGVNISGGWLNVEGSNFHDNEVAISINNQNLNRIKVNRSKFSNNNSFDVYYGGNSGSALNFQYNWWGNSNGPSKTCYQDDCYYEKLEREINFSNWLKSENFHDPVILIPGILGSQKKDGKWSMDLVLHTYDNLYSEFTNNGYTPDVDLFEFPYEWRDSNIENAKLLENKIQEIKEKNNWPKVDIVAHSMGGLLAREYVESDYYADDVDQLVTLGTPNNGAPEAYLKWDGDGWFWGLNDVYTKHILGQEADESGYADTFDYIHQRPISSIQELLPVYDYLQDVENNNQYKIYPKDYPTNNFLENLNSASEKEKLNNIEFDKIPPTVIIASPQDNQTYKNNQILEIKYTVSDETTSSDKIKTELFLDDQVIDANNNNKIDLSLEHLGTHTFSIIAEDEVGNKSEETKISFESKTDIDAIINNVNHYFNLNLITKKSAKQLLTARLNAIKIKINLLKIFQNKWMSKFAKERIMENMKKEINKEIEKLISDIENKNNFRENIDGKVGDILVEGLKNSEL